MCTLNSEYQAVNWREVISLQPCYIYHKNEILSANQSNPGINTEYIATKCEAISDIMTQSQICIADTFHHLKQTSKQINKDRGGEKKKKKYGDKIGEMN